MKFDKLILIISALCILGILFVPFKLCQFFFYLILFVFLFSFLYALNLKNCIKVEHNYSKLKLASKEKVDITFTIKNYSRLPVFTCYFFDDVPYLYVYNEGNKGITMLRPGEIKKITYKVSARDRGLYQIGPLKVKTSDPLCLFTIEYEVPSLIEVTVRPARNKLITKTFPGFPQGNIKINNVCYEDITMRRSVREYKNGDEQKRINWRASAKTGELFTNQYEDSYDSPFFVFLDLGEDDYDLKNRLFYTEKAIEIAANIVEKSRFLGQRCGFAAFGTDFPYLKPAKNQADAILDILSVIQTVPGKLDYDPVKKFKNQLPAGTLIFIITENEIRKYFNKVEANLEDINTENTGILKK